MLPRIDPHTPIGTWVWCCHHTVPLERLISPAGERTAYIEKHKPKHEQIVRHACFQVVKDSTTAERLWRDRALADDFAWAEYRKAMAAKRAEQQNDAQAWAEYQQVAVLEGAEYYKALGLALAPILDLYRKEYPENAHLVNEYGHLIFPQR